MDTAFSLHIVGRIDQIKAKAIESHPNLNDQITAICEDDDISDLVKFHYCNNLVPVEKRMKVCPSTAVSHSFVPLSSTTLNAMFKLRLDNNDKGLVIATLFGCDYGSNRKVDLIHFISRLAS